MGSKKHKKHKSERKEREEKNLLLERPPSLKLILKVSGNSSTPEHGNDSPAYGIHQELGAASFSGEYSGERHKKSKKKKKKKDREKKHKHHKEKRRHRDDSSQEDFNSVGDESSQAPTEGGLFFGAPPLISGSPASIPVTRPLAPMKSPEPEPMMVVQQPATPATPATPMMIMTKEEITGPSSVTTEEPMQSPGSVQSGNSRPGSKMEFHDTNSNQAPKTPGSDCSGREPRSCVLKLKQSRSPLARLLDHLLKALEKRDPHQFFAWPVTDDIAPGYSSIISKPMDFSTIRQKIDDNEYTSVSEFSDDFKLMCDNAIRYNHSETVYHKAAKKLLHVGARLLQPENLMRSLRPLMTYMRELTSKELGFELPASADNQDNEHHTLDSADEAVAAAVDEGINAQINAQIEEDEKRKQIRLENNPTTKFEPFVDDLTAEEVLQQVQSAALNARTKMLKKKSANRMGFLRQLKNGTTSMNILIANENNAPEKVVSLESFTGKLQYGTAQLQGFREDRRNYAKTVKPLNYGAFSSFAPVFDSRFSNLSKEETDMVLNTYGDETGADYAESIMKYTKDSPYAGGIAHSLLDILTNGEHRKTFATLYESDMQRQEKEAVKHTFPEPGTEQKQKQKQPPAEVKIDYDGLRSLSSIGVDMQFLDELELQLKGAEATSALQQSLNQNSGLLQKLHQIQSDRLSAPLPAHLSFVQRAGEGEIDLAAQITGNLTAMAKQLPPVAISSPHGLRKAMGMSNVGLDMFQNPPVGIINPQPNVGSLQHGNSQGGAGADIIDTTPMDMDLEPETVPVVGGGGPLHHPNPNPSQVDIDSELRELLGTTSSSNSVAESDAAASIEQMLMD